MTIQIINLQAPLGKNPFNPLGKETRIHIHNSLKQAIANQDITSIILFGGTNFSAGADIAEFSAKNQDPKAAIESSAEIPSLTDLVNLIESSHKPVIGAITGVALGGGCELSLACHFRVAHEKARMGLPEVKIGLIPGAGGTQRLPRLCKDVAWALDVVTSGRMVGMQEAKTKHVVDEIVQGGLEDVLSMAKKYAKYGELMRDMTYRRVCNQNVIADDDAEGMKRAKLICDKMARKLPSKERGGEALRAALTAIRASFEKDGFDAGMEVESELFWDLLLNSSQGRGLRHAFFAERAAQKGNPKLMSGPIAQAFMKKKGEPPLVGVIGAGTMGAGIAVGFLRAGCKVILVDVNQKGLERGVENITKIFQQDVVKKRMASAQSKHILSNKFSYTTDMKTGHFCNCLLVVEAVFENLKIKQSIFTQLDQIVKNPHALLLSNTSTLSIDSIASALSPERRPYCAGMHFFSPAHIMKLVEIVVSSTSSPETIALVQFITSKKLRKVGVTVGNCQGFVGNRMINPYSAEAVFLLEEGGAKVPEVDTALYSFGMAMGPLNMGDLAGNDIGYLIAKSKGLAKDPKTGKPGPNRKPGMRYSDVGDDLVTKLGRIGMKAQKGWYDYDIKVGKGRKPIPSKEVEDFITGYVKGPVKKFSQQEIVERCLFGLINEGFKILEEDIAQKPSDIDVIYLFGYGWPAYRGGPMYWIDNEVGLPYFLKGL
jgi:3-hydroxyacyl-CoA dehydrogenase/enoyl-CoA hydratase/carnithine racemase